MAKRHKSNEGDFDTTDTSDRHRGDAYLRRHGFRIKARPKVGPTLWERQNKNGDWIEYTEENARRWADSHEQAFAGALA